MKKLRSKRRFWRNTVRFVTQNGQLLFLIAIILLGVLAGNSIFFSLTAEHRRLVNSFLSLSSAPIDFAQGCVTVVSSMFSELLLLFILFLLGMTSYGCPLILLMPPFFGILVGVMQAGEFLSGTFLSMVLTIVVPACIAGTSVVMATMQSLHMSCMFSRQLLPNYAHCGSLWHDFKLYLLRFLLCLCIAVAAAVIRILLCVYIVL